jgi:hypothetical protein
MQSEFLAVACRAGFKVSGSSYTCNNSNLTFPLQETQEGKIDLPDDDPQLVHIMVHYLYHFDYDTKPQDKGIGFDGSVTNRDETDTNEPVTNVLVTHAKVYALAEKYLSVD